MAVKLGYGGFANTNGARDFSGKGAAPVVVAAYRFRGNSLNRRRYGGLWYPVILWLLMI